MPSTAKIEPTATQAARKPPVRKVSVRTWYLLYFLLAAFDIATVSLSVMFNREIQGIYDEAITVNQAWSRRLHDYRELQLLAAAVNAPGNDVFDTRNVSGEREKMRTALRAFDSRLELIRRELGSVPAKSAEMFRDLDAVKAAMVGMAVQAETLFKAFETGGPDAAGREMARMNRSYDVLSRAFHDLREGVGRLQNQLFAEEKEQADSRRNFEHIIAACIVLMVGGAAFYGYRLARQMRDDARAMAGYIQELHAADLELRRAHDELEERVKERTGQLAQTNQALEAEVGERRRAEVALRESERRFRVMADTAPVMIWMAGADKRPDYFNKVWLTFTGRTADLAGKGAWTDCVHAEDLHQCQQVYDEAFSAQKPFEREYRLRRADGEYRWVYDQGTPRFQSDGAFVGYIGSCVDITERKRAEESLRESERLFHTLAQVSPVGIVRADKRGKCVFANERWCQLAGFTEDQAMGEGWLQAIHPEDRERVFTEWYQAMAHGQQFQLEYRMLSPAGTLTWVYGQSEVEKSSDGEVQGYVNTITDITSHKRTEEQLRQLMQRAELVERVTNDVIWDWDLVTNQIWWNEALTRVLGYRESEAEPVAAWWVERIHPDQRPEIMNRLYSLLDGGGHLWADEYRCRKADGTYIWAAARGQVVRDRHGKAIRMVGSLTNIDDRKRA